MTSKCLYLALPYLNRISQARVLHQGRVARARIDSLFPSLRQDLMGQHRLDLQPYHERYVREVSSSKRAVSLDLAVFMSILCDLIRPERIIDFGSGFSSFVLRRYQVTAEPHPEVWSVEGSPGWLERTSDFLREQGLPTDHLLDWSDFIQLSPGRFDLVLADSFRDVGEPGGNNYSLFLDLLAPNGLLVLDDFQKQSYRANAYQALRSREFTLMVMSDYLRDSFGRYPALVARPEALSALGATANQGGRAVGART